MNECCSVAVSVDKLSGAADEVRLLRDQLAGRDAALTLAHGELDAVRRQVEQLNHNYQTALSKYDNQQSVYPITSCSLQLVQSCVVSSLLAVPCLGPRSTHSCGGGAQTLEGAAREWEKSRLELKRAISEWQ